MKFRARKVLRLGPFYFNFASGGQQGLRPRFSSWGIAVGPFRKNFTRGTWSVDTPGPGSINGGGRRR